MSSHRIPGIAVLAAALALGCYINSSRRSVPSDGVLSFPEDSMDKAESSEPELTGKSWSLELQTDLNNSSSSSLSKHHITKRRNRTDLISAKGCFGALASLHMSLNVLDDHACTFRIGGETKDSLLGERTTGGFCMDFIVCGLIIATVGCGIYCVVQTSGTQQANSQPMVSSWLPAWGAPPGPPVYGDPMMDAPPGPPYGNPMAAQPPYADSTAYPVSSGLPPPHELHSAMPTRKENSACPVSDGQQPPHELHSEMPAGQENTAHPASGGLQPPHELHSEMPARQENTPFREPYPASS